MSESKGVIRAAGLCVSCVITPGNQVIVTETMKGNRTVTNMPVTVALIWLYLYTVIAP